MTKNNKFVNIVFYVLCIVAFFIMCQNYATNCYGIVDRDWFEKWQKDSEWLVRQRMIDDDRFGFRHNSGLLGEWKPQQASEYEYDEDHGVYPIQVGLQGMISGVIYKISHSFEVAQWLEVILFVLSIFFLLKWIRDEFGCIPSIFLYIAIFFNKWIIVSARNLYWAVWTLMLPMLFLLFYLKNEEKSGKENFKAMVLIEFIMIFIRSACGYEFISLVMIDMEVPLFYYMVKNRWEIKKFVKRFFSLGAAALLGFITAFVVNMIQLFLYYGGQWDLLIDLLKWKISYRTGIGNLDSYTGIVLESLNAAKSGVLATYFKSGTPLIGELRMDRLIIWIFVGISLTFVSGNISKRIAAKRSKLLALDVMCAVSFLGPISWFILASPHAFIHTHICYILWSLPFLILGEAIIFTVATLLFMDICQKMRFYMTIPLLIIVCVVIFFYCNDYSSAMKAQENIYATGLEIYDSPTMKVYLDSENIYYISRSRSERQHMIFLHFITSGTGEMDGMEESFINNDFRFESHEKDMAFWSPFRMAVVPLPGGYDISAIETGQYSGNEIFWQTKINMLNNFTICNILDENWNHGFSRAENIVLVESSDRLFELIKGKYLVFPDGSRRQVVDIKQIDNIYYYIYVDEHIEIESDDIIIQVEW